VKLSGECRWDHLQASAGSAATVVDVLRSPDDGGHSYAIEYDDRTIGEPERYCVGEYVCADDWLAAIEMEPESGRILA
jgi:hypothetical protein